ncbi:protein-methionine-sulfoxide reductase heme-binding subunit MsrQ [Ferrimonas pelagia]|uniref:Protein-methionine-sulfoxide reductase heme-binding subunit MsrQ n=1 Tax=Ferrimonas pelagia TaxID=1177826 RepID=A0ABP9F2G2_9GAMM
MTLKFDRIFWLKAGMHLACALPLLYLYLRVQSGAAGGDPVQYLIHFLGMGILHTLAVTLSLSPLARRLRMGWLIRTRRLMGLWTFTYAALHLAAFVVFDLLGDWRLLLSEVIERPYITVGMLAFVILLLLAITSPMWAQRKLGRRWQALHRGVYLVALLGPIHFWWSVKSGDLEPALYLSGFVALLLCRPWLRRGLVKGWRRLRLRATATPWVDQGDPK